MKIAVAALNALTWLCYGCAEVHQTPPDAGSVTAIRAVSGALADAEPDLSYAWFVDSAVADGEELIVVVSSVRGTCEHAQAHGREPASSWLLTARVTHGHLDGEVRVPGTYAIRSSESPAVVSLQLGDAACANSLPGGPSPLSPEEGIVVFDSHEDGQLQGHYELEFAIGLLEGTFRADSCPIDPSREEPPNCVPPVGS